MMKLRHILGVLYICMSLHTSLEACSGTGEIALCNIIHQPAFLANGLVWVGEPLDSCQTYNSYAGNFTACLFEVKEIFHGTINQSDTTYSNTDSLVWLIGGPSNLCYETSNYTDGQYLLATRFQSHYAYDHTFSGYSTFAFNADRFELMDTMVGNFMNDINYFDPSVNLGPDTILINQLQNVVNNCLSEIRTSNQKIEISKRNDNTIFTIDGDLSSYQIEIIGTNRTVVDSHASPQSLLHIDTNALPDGLYFVKIQHNVWEDVYVERILKE